MLGFLKKHFLTGLLAMTPVAITGLILWRFYLLISNTMRPSLARLPALSEAYPDFLLNMIGFAVFLLLITLVGIFTRNLIGMAFFRLVERVIERIPVVKTIFTAIKQMSEVLLRDRRTAFQKTVLFQYPRPGIYCLGFVTRDEPDNPLVNVFLPTTPNPTSGFLLILPRAELAEVPFPVEEAIKLVVSGGAIMTPEQAAVISGKAGFPATPGESTESPKDLNS